MTDTQKCAPCRQIFIVSDGTAITAARGGVVITSTYNSSYGNYVVISHANGESTLYAHMLSLIHI